MKYVKSDWYEGLLKAEFLCKRDGLEETIITYYELRRLEGWCNVEYYKGFREYLENYEERNNDN
jgi:hypothetical protein